MLFFSFIFLNVRVFHELSPYETLNILDFFKISSKIPFLSLSLATLLPRHLLINLLLHDNDLACIFEQI